MPATSGDHIEAVHEAEQRVQELEATRDELREVARRRLGITGRDLGSLPPLREVFRKHGVSWYPLAAVGLLAMTDTFQRFGLSVLVPEMSRTLGISKATISGILAAQTVVIALAPLQIAAFVQRRPRRALTSVAFGVMWSAFMVGMAFVVSPWGLALCLMAGAVGQASVHSLHPPLLFDIYPPESRVRLLSRYQSFDAAGNVVAPLLVAIGATLLGLTWRGVFAGLGVISLMGCVVAMRLRDPGFGQWDERMIRRTVRDHEKKEGATTDQVRAEDVTLGFFEIARRLLLIPTVRRLLVGYAMLGVLLVPYQTFLFFFLDERWGMGPGARGVFFALAAVASIIGLTAFGTRAERIFRKEPAGVVRLASTILIIGVVLICLGGVMPWFGGMAACFMASHAVLALLRPSIAPAFLGIIPAYMRPHAAALTGVFVGGVGGMFGALFLTGIDARFGVGAAMVSLLIPGLLGAVIIRTAAKFVPGDLDRMIDEVIEDEEIRLVRQKGGHLPMLACRSIDFSYGQLQVLFDVDFTVDDGEMVALLGVNGAGKSTLLKVVSGIALPSTGSVRLGGVDITYLDAERRVGLGITQVPGGRAVFGPMSVYDNLRTLGYAIGSDRRRLDEAIDTCFETFPRLAERRDQMASTLSGGEQQMLGLSKALILKPRLLLIDELSLGLAPVVVGQLLELVRKINDSGTAVVLVEQSVNVALNLVDHAYFMEKGEMRFDGAAKDLLARDDLLRAVFLDGVSATDTTTTAR